MFRFEAVELSRHAAILAEERDEKSRCVVKTQDDLKRAKEIVKIKTQVSIKLSIEKSWSHSLMTLLFQNKTNRIFKRNKAGYTANKQSLAGGQGQYTEGQGQLISWQGLYLGWAGALMLRNHKYGQIRGIRNFA